MKRSLLSLVCIIAVLFITSCATLLTGTRQEVTINSKPQDASIYTATFNKKNIKDGTWRQLDSLPSQKIGNTPMTSKINRNTRLIFVTKEGFQDTLIYCMARKVKIKTIEPNTGRQIKKIITPAKYHSRTNPIFLGNLIFGGTIGMLIDILSGAALKMDERMDVALSPE